MPSHPRAVVAIPVRNEEMMISTCLHALSRQTRPPDAVLLLLNNCTDDTVGAAQAFVETFAGRLHIGEASLAGADANAGMARRLAMAEAASLAVDNGIVLTTDADGRVEPDWVARNLAEIEQGADLVCGTASIDPEDEKALPAALLADDAAECRLIALLDEIDTLIDPPEYDHWPRHTQNSGASIAITSALLRRIGGVPEVPLGEDRALVQAARRQDARIRHALGINVVVSGRLVGRAEGGMAATMARRVQQQDRWADDTLEPTDMRVRRATARRLARAAWKSEALRSEIVPSLAAALQMRPRRIGDCLEAAYFGAAWGLIEELSPLLRRPPIAMTDLVAHGDAASAVLQGLLGEEAVAA